MIDPEIRPYRIKSHLVCPNCKGDINTAAGITPEHSQTVHKGGIWVCASCSAPSIMGDFALEPLTKERFDLLDPRTQRALAIVVNKLKEIIAQNEQGN